MCILHLMPESEENNMPKITDISGNVVEELPYTEEGVDEAHAMVNANPSLNIDYAPGGEVDAMNRSESYELGGKIPGQLGFGVRPPRPILDDSVAPTAPGFGDGQGHVGDRDWFDDPRKGGGAYKKGGKVK